ncbi:MAG: hypothetical protein LBG05_08480 [Treponema sp.]|jgi:hypothetical protein|nr:hypothetical protein [Treponema sp.]
MEIHTKIENTPVLCFDTGLKERAFAQAGLSRLITQEGIIVRSNGTIEKWRIEGTAERDGNMVVWGKNFIGQTLDVILDGEANEAFSAVRFWLKAQIRLKQTVSEVKNAVSIAPCGVICSNEALLFLPEQLVVRYVEAKGETVKKIMRYVHPDLTGEKAVVWSLACMLYHIFCENDAFLATDADILRQDMREGVFFPARFARPGIDGRIDSLLQRTFSHSMQNFPTLEDFSFLNVKDDVAENRDSLAFLPVDEFIYVLSYEETKKLILESTRFSKKQKRLTIIWRFFKKNRAIIFGSVAAVVVAAVIVISVIQDRANLPNTKGMTPLDVVETYYTAMSNLDHLVMTGCVLKKAGKDDIDMTSELFVLSKIRQAYEMGKPPSIISAETWLQSGAQPTTAVVFGTSHLEIQPLDTDVADGEVSFKAEYKLWAPAFNPSPNDEAIESPRVPGEQPRVDEIRLVLHKRAWRIAEIKRSLGK